MKKIGIILAVITLLLAVFVPAAFGAEDNTLALKYDDRKDLSAL